MKELTIEEKLEEAKMLYKDANADQRYVLESLFPELAEIEDVRIRKALINGFNKLDKSALWYNGITNGQILSWLEKQTSNADNANKEYWRGYCEGKQVILDKYAELEKQCEQKPAENLIETWKDMRLEVYQQASGNRHEPNCSDDTTKMFSLNDIDEIVEKMSEQKPTDKAEHKFKVGDWIFIEQIDNIINGPYKIKEVNEYGYDYVLDGIRETTIPFTSEDCMSLWTIQQNAKKGDVLSYRDGQWIFIYKEKIDDNSFCYYALYSTIHQDLTINDAGFTLLGDAITPATKEQRDTLMKAMADAGYTFDFDKKELRKIIEEVNDEDYGIDGLWHAQTILEKTLGKVDGYQSDDGILEHKCAITAVKKLYEQKTAEWNEEDEKIFNGIILRCKKYGNQEQIDWLKSLRPQNRWKPSDEQIKTLDFAIDCTVYPEFNIHRSVLKELLEQLKKLRKE